METKFNITELVCTRISHDLTGNVGAFANAVELLEDNDTEYLEDIKSTLKFSSAVLAARLKFFRMAFGLTNSNLKNPPIVTQTCEEYLKSLNPNYPITISLQPQPEQSGFNRALMLAVMAVADIIVRGGQINITADNQKMTARVISGYSLAQSKIDDIKKILADEDIENPSQYAPLFCLLDMGAKVKIDTSEGFALIIA